MQGQELRLLGWSDSILSAILSSIVLFACGLLLNNIANRYQFFDSPSNLPAAIFYTFTPFILDNFSLGPWLLVLVFTLFVLNKILKAYAKSRPGSNFFDAAFLLTCCAIVFPQYIFYIAALILCIFIVNIPRLAYFKLVLVGVFIPLTLFFTLQVSMGNELLLFFKINQVYLEATDFSAISFSSFSIPLLVLFSFGLISYFFWQSRKPYLQNMQSPILLCSTVIVIVGIIISLLFLPLQLQSFMGAYFGLAFVISFLFYYTNNNLASVLFLILTGFAIAYPWIIFKS